MHRFNVTLDGWQARSEKTFAEDVLLPSSVLASLGDFNSRGDADLWGSRSERTRRRSPEV